MRSVLGVARHQRQAPMLRSGFVHGPFAATAQKFFVLAASSTQRTGQVDLTNPKGRWGRATLPQIAKGPLLSA